MDDYLKKQQEWQSKQYSPGYYTGGRVPVWMFKPGKPAFLGFVFLFSALAILIVFVFSLIASHRLSAGDIVMFAFFIVYSIASFKYFRQARTSK